MTQKKTPEKKDTDSNNNKPASTVQAPESTAQAPASTAQVAKSSVQATGGTGAADKTATTNATSKKNVASKTQQESKSEPTQTASPQQASSRNGLPALALVVACIALMTSGFLWYQNKESMEQKQGLEAQVSGSVQTIESLRESQQAEQQSRLQMQAIVQQQSETISSSEAQILELHERINELQKQLLPERDRLLLARVRELIYQAQSIISVSNQNIGYVRDLLLEAQGTLASVTDPYWDNLRRALVVDIEAMEAVKSANAITVYEQIESLRRAIRTLDFLPESEQDRQAEEPQLDNTEPANLMESFAKKIANQLKNMVVIRENQGGIMIQLSADSFQHVKLLLESGLSQAQLGLMQQNQQTFEKSLMQVRRTLEQRLQKYTIGDQLAKIANILNTDVFESPDSLASYPALKALEEQHK